MLPTLLIASIHSKVLCPLDSDDFNLAPSLRVTGISFSVEGATYVTAVLHDFELPSLKVIKIVVDALRRLQAALLLCALS
jgi:hypothetical protein